MLNSEPISPVIHNSQWVALSEEIEAGTRVCVPIDPWESTVSWVYSQGGCKLLNQGLYWDKNVKNIVPHEIYGVYPDEILEGSKLISVGVLVRPLKRERLEVSGRIEISFKNGTKKSFVGRRIISQTGGLFLINCKSELPVDQIKVIKIAFNKPVEVLSSRDGNSVRVSYFGI
jgi:hypothetical protein